MFCIRSATSRSILTPQTIKALVLARVTPKSFKSLSDSVVKTLGVPALPQVNPDPQGSNVYGLSERVILAWLNHHFEHLRANLWLEAQQVGNGGGILL